jgi:hypothetical protein
VQQQHRDGVGKEDKQQEDRGSGEVHKRIAYSAERPAPSLERETQGPSLRSG